MKILLHLKRLVTGFCILFLVAASVYLVYTYTDTARLVAVAIAGGGLVIMVAYFVGWLFTSNENDK